VATHTNTTGQERKGGKEKNKKTYKTIRNTKKEKKKKRKKDTAKGRRGALSWEARVSSKAPWGTQLVGR
jgi:hypothetical protein